MRKRPEREVTELLSWERVVAALAGAVLILVSVLVLTVPPAVTSTTRGLDGELIESTTTVLDLTAYATALLGAGLFLVVYALNGVRLTKFSAGSFSAEASRLAREAKRVLSSREAREHRSIVQGSESASPESDEPPITHVDDADGTVAVYTLDAIPSRVLADAVYGLEQPPSTLQDFEFASRRTGRGNHPWTLKFSGMDPIIVAYGGRAKSGATVDQVPLHQEQ